MTRKPTRAPFPNLFLMVALFCLCLSWIWELNDTNPDLTYSDVRQLILQEKVEELTVSDYTLTLKLREELEGTTTVRYELYDFQYSTMIWARRSSARMTPASSSTWITTRITPPTGPRPWYRW